jgi:hypothetical protein
MKLEELQNRVNQLIEMASAILANQHVRPTERHGGVIIAGGVSISGERFHEFRSASLSFMSRLLGLDHILCQEFTSKVVSAQPHYVIAGRGILKALKQEIDGGWLFTVKGLVAAELFTDFLEMAGHLLEEGYKDPAAVMIGSVLEEHLRQLCARSGVDTTIHDAKTGRDVPKKADRMNNDLTAAGVYNKLYQKTILGWLDLRNQAAHGHYTEYDIKQVQLMESGVVDFIAKTS